MITSTIRAKLVAFIVIALVATSYLAAKYVGLDPFARGYQLEVELPDAGGLFVNSEVTYRGVQIGSVEKLTVTDDGMVATLEIESGAPDIPEDAEATVANRSAIGEQYLDLSSDAGGGPFLADGDRLTGDEDALPPAFDDVLRSGRDFLASVPEGSLRTVIDETYSATRGLGDDFGVLLDTSLEWAKTSQANLLVTTRLIESSATVLDTQIASSDDITSFSADLALITETLRTHDSELRTLISQSPAAMVELHTLFRDVGQPLGMLMGNLVSTAQVFGVNALGVEDALIRVPDAVSIGWLVAGSGSLNLGLSTSFTRPVPCTTGYGGTTVRPGTDTAEGEPFNTAAGCAVAPSTGVDVRGPASVPAQALTTGAASMPAPTGVVLNDVDDLSDLLGGTS
ncbi:MlaD family protein [Aeromicrobium sp. Leaf350]|uniref:MlaD family protein n=1 Tax=Aeromicrobium sp. Leaf350 TaxID=2876565 RepID=UPI001E62842C|nr:MlaD family protein [Aeromicrobium sp. Leaf350]